MSCYPKRCPVTGKLRHEDRRKAREHVRRVRCDGYRPTVYRCSFCETYHVGGPRR